MPFDAYCCRESIDSENELIFVTILMIIGILLLRINSVFD